MAARLRCPCLPCCLPAPAYPAAVVSLWNVPYRRNPVLQRAARSAGAGACHLRQRLSAHRHAGAHRAGRQRQDADGLEYAYRYQEEYQAVFWAQAETRGQLLGRHGAACRAAELARTREQEQALVVAAVRRWLEAHPGWLLVLDNVEELKLLQEVLPTRGQGHVLLTTRAQALGSLAAARPRGGLADRAKRCTFCCAAPSCSQAEAPLEAVPPEQQRAARAIVEELGGLPLALDQAGAYIEETACTLEDYLNVTACTARRCWSMRARAPRARWRGRHLGGAFEQVERAARRR